MNQKLKTQEELVAEAHEQGALCEWDHEMSPRENELWHEMKCDLSKKAEVPQAEHE
jgi:hypothetical protein